MTKPKPRTVREPIQVYMDLGERRLLDQLSQAAGISRAEVLRRGLRSFAAEQAGYTGPMQTFMQSLRSKPMTKNIAADHDQYLEAAYRDKHAR